MILAYTRAKVLVAEAADDEDDLPWQIGTNYRLYQRWWHVATHRGVYSDLPDWINHLFVEMMKTPHTLNIFMHALGTQSRTLYHAIKVLQRMDTGHLTMTTPEGDLTAPIAAPNLHSWSILLNAFARHGQVEAAEKCFKTMRRKGVRPDETAWNTLVKAHAINQDPEGVMAVLRRKESAGFGMDHGIVRVLRRVKDHDKLKALLCEEVSHRETGVSDATLLGRGDAEEKKKKKKRSWGPRDGEVVGYEPGVGKRAVQYFDANRTAGLHREAWSGVEEREDVVGYTPVGMRGVGGKGRILEGQGSFTLKSDDERDWFEDDDGEEGKDVRGLELKKPLYN